MYDYSKVKNFEIENVDYDIHILGVKASAMPWCVYLFLGFLAINPFLAIFATLSFISVVRKFYFFEKQGFPLEYEPYIIKAIQKTPLLKDLFLDHLHIELAKEDYRA